MDIGLQILKIAGSLALVIAVMLATVLGLKRLGKHLRKTEGNPWINVLAQHPVGLKHHLVLVSVQDQMFLVGVSPQSVHFLTQVQQSSAAAAPPNGSQQ